MAHEFIYTCHKLARVHPPDKTVLENISLSFYPGAKIGVLGSNGAGKSSLLKIMAGLDDGYSGTARLTPGFSVGYLQQEPQLDPTKTVQGNVEEAVTAQRGLLKEFEQISMAFAEPMIKALWEEGGGSFPNSPIRQMTYADALEKYGIDRPDLRYGLEISDVTNAFRGVDFPFTNAAIAEGARVRGIRIPGGATLSRKQLDEIDATAKSAGARGVLRVKRVNGVIEGGVGKVLTEQLYVLD